MSTGYKLGELRQALEACRGYFVTAGSFSLAINLLYLAAPIYMLQVYDRVVPSASITTLVMLTVLLLLAFGILTALDSLRGRILTRATIRLDRLLAGRIIAATVEQSTKGVSLGSETLRDFDNFRQCITGPGVHAVFDLPWAPIYILVIFMLHPILGAFALACAAILVGLALIGQWRVKAPLSDAGKASSRNLRFTEMSLRNAEVVQAMGMLPGLLQRWARDRNLLIERQVVASDVTGTTSSIVRFFRLSMQSLMLGLGAILVIERDVTVGTMFAGSILLARALQPVEQIVGAWRTLVSARDAFQRSERLLTANPPDQPRLALPRPLGRVEVENLSFALPRSTKPILRNISVRIEPGEIIGVIGPSGAGKSTLARHLVGVLKPSAGTVRLDGADLSAWPPQSLGNHIGYLPQDVELFSDTVATNISRFQVGSDEAVIAAAQLAGVHDMVLRLPNGYETPIGDDGMALSGGYRQRIGLARAVFGRPSLVVLDEPSSNLDAEGDEALTECIVELKRRQTTVIVVSHRPATIAVADKILLLIDGAVAAFGPRAEVLARLAHRPAAVTAVTSKGVA